MKKISFKNIVWKEDKHYVAQCLNIDVSSFGITKKEAVFNLKEALALRLEGISGTDIAKVVSPELIETNLQYA